MTLAQIGAACNTEPDAPKKGKPKKSKYAIPIRGPEDVAALFARQEARRLGNAR